jgi:hypothetical protein
MTVTVTEHQFYLGLVILLLFLQVRQQWQIRKLQKESEKVWEQIGIFISALANQLVSLQKDIESKQNKQ